MLLNRETWSWWENQQFTIKIMVSEAIIEIEKNCGSYWCPALVLPVNNDDEIALVEELVQIDKVVAI